VEGGCPDDSTCTNLLKVDPQFVDAGGADDTAGTLDDDLRLSFTPPAIDAGDNSAVPGSVTTDLDGNPRFWDVPGVPDTGSGSPPVVDMGAYEIETSCIYLPLVVKD
jgi:hypothetical protein